MSRLLVQAGLTSVMCRTERPRVGVHGMLAEEDHPVGPIPPNDLIDLGRVASPRRSARSPDHSRVLEVGALLRELPRRLQAGRATARPVDRDGPPTDAFKDALRQVQTLDHSPSTSGRRSTSEVPASAPSPTRPLDGHSTSCSGCRHPCRITHSTGPTETSTPQTAPSSSCSPLGQRRRQLSLRFSHTKQIASSARPRPP